MSTFGEKIKGSFDLVFLYGRGIKPFEAEGTRQAALRSLWIPVLMYPFIPFVTWFYPPHGMHEGGYTYGQMVYTSTIVYLIGFALTTGLAWSFSYVLGRRDKFWLYFQASNWASIGYTVVTLPVMALMVFDVMPREELHRISVIATCYGFIVTGCIAYRAFRVPWELAGSLACLTLALSHEAWKIVYHFQNIEAVW